MSMRNRFYQLAMIAFLLMGGTQSVSAQGFLDKIGKAIEKGTKKLEKVNKKLEEVNKDLNELNPNKKVKEKRQKTSSNENNVNDDEDDDWSIESKLKGHPSNVFRYMVSHSEDVKKDFIQNYCEFKTTSSTKTITVDRLKDIQLGYFHDGRAFVNTPANGMLCIDTKGNIVKRWTRNDELTVIRTGGADYPKFDSGRFIILEKAEKYKYYGTAVIYDTNFNVIKRIPQVSSVTNYEDGVAIICKYTGKLPNTYEDAYIDINGNEIFQNLSRMANSSNSRLQSTDLRPLRDGLAAYAVKKGLLGASVWGFRDAKGNPITQPIYSQVQDFSNGMAAVLVEQDGQSKWGFIDTKGNMVIEPKYTKQPSQFDNCGLAMVCNKDGLCSFINKKGEIVSKTYEKITPFNNGRAIYTEYLTQGGEQEDNSYFSTYSGLTYLIDSNFNIVATLGRYLLNTSGYVDNGMHYFHKGSDINSNYSFERYSNYSIGTSFVNGQIYLNLDDISTGLLSKNGDVIIGGLTGFYSEGIAPVNHSHELNRSELYAGYVNEKGEWIIQFKENDF